MLFNSPFPYVVVQQPQARRGPLRWFARSVVLLLALWHTAYILNPAALQAATTGRVDQRRQAKATATTRAGHGNAGTVESVER